MTERKTGPAAYDLATKALDGLAAHEDVCAERYRRLDEQISDVKDGMKWALRLLVGCLIAVCAFFLKQQMGV